MSEPEDIADDQAGELNRATIRRLRSRLRQKSEQIARLQAERGLAFQQAQNGTLLALRAADARAGELERCVRAADAVRADYGRAMECEGYKWRSPTMTAYDAARAQVTLPEPYSSEDGRETRGSEPK